MCARETLRIYKCGPRSKNVEELNSKRWENGISTNRNTLLHKVISLHDKII